MRPLHSFFVEPSVPEQLAALVTLAYDLKWSWDAEARELFRRLDPDLWEKSGHNPVRMLGEIDPSRYQALVEDESFRYLLKGVLEEEQSYHRGGATWFDKDHPGAPRPLAAYFSAEFGICDAIPIFSGGLGVLAGDHLKSASDMGVPLVGVGLAYQSGYFRQYLNPDGWQQESYPVNDFHIMPLRRVPAADGKSQLAIEVPFPGRVVKAWVWQAEVGRLPLYLLDSNHPDNNPGDRQITGQLYGGDQETRIQQEIILGMGGVRMLATLGLDPPVLHSNEGHAAFLTLERTRQLMQRHGLSFWAAREAAQAGIIFTTHTPVPAGIDVFPRHLIETYFSDYVRETGISMEQLLDIGRMPGDGNGFNMAVLAVRMSHGTNAVSRLHRTTSRRMWRDLWPGLHEQEFPIGSITNGIHIPSWISAEMGGLFDRYLGPRWREDPRDREIWQRVQLIPAEELWRTHERRRERLVAFARQRTQERLLRHGVGGRKLEMAQEVLNPEALTIGFARRFAPYKRANLLFRDPERLAAMLTCKERPVQVLIAGKAHPRDQFGKEIIQAIYASSRRPELASRIVFLEDYDLNTARYLVQGVDIWLNTPRRPKEASGTSGMKAVANGALHLSTRDGWWDEVNAEGLGWSIGAGEEYEESQHEYGDEVEAKALYDVLESVIVPLFYQRRGDGLPRGWIQTMKNSMMELCPGFNSSRMVRQYTKRYYLPAAAHFQRLVAGNLERARKLADWRRQVQEHWSRVELLHYETDIREAIKVGEVATVRAWLRLSPLQPDDVAVEVLHGRIGPNHEILDPQSVPMPFLRLEQDHSAAFQGLVPCIFSGRVGLAIRVMPRHPDLPNPQQMALVKRFG